MEKRYPPRERRTSRRILAENLRLYRLRRHIPQDELAYMVGLDRSYFGAVERGARNIAVDNLDKIAAALGVPVAQLLTEPQRPILRRTWLRISAAGSGKRAGLSTLILASVPTLSRSREDAPT